jgi:hypothetical protein
VIAVVDHTVSALLRKPFRNRLANPRTRSRNNCNLAFQATCHADPFAYADFFTASFMGFLAVIFRRRCYREFASVFSSDAHFTKGVCNVQ